MKITSHNLQRWVSWSMAVVLVLSIGFWYFTRDRLPQVIRLATGEEGGQYHEFGKLLQKVAKRKVGDSIQVELVSTSGSGENYKLLQDGKVDLVIVQGGSVDLVDPGETSGQSIIPAVIAPLYPDIMHIVVRREAGISEIVDLTGRRVIVGKEGSGMLMSSTALIEHYGLNLEEGIHEYFTMLSKDPELDGAIITTGVLNEDLQKLLHTGDFVLLPVRDAEAIQMYHSYCKAFTIPRGLYREQPPVPGSDVSTLATTAFLVGRRDAPDLLTEFLLESVYEEGMRMSMPTLLSREQARDWLDMPMHPVARRYFDPQDEIGHMAAVMESLAATKELLFALIAVVYLMWERWRRLKEKEERIEFEQQKSHLDDLLTRTLEIESRQIGVKDVKQLRQMMEEVTRVKLQALEELTHEELRGDRSFLIFLTQSSALSSKIQAKISDYRRSELADKKGGGKDG